MFVPSPEFYLPNVHLHSTGQSIKANGKTTKLEDPGIDPGTSRMQSGRSTI